MKLPAKLQKEHKYHAKRTTCLYGHNHDSRKEAMWCVKLNELAKERKIVHLIIEPCYELVVNGELICKHLPDFRYLKIIAPHVYKEEVVDVKGDWKGGQRPEWKLKHKLFCVLYPEINYLVV